MQAPLFCFFQILFRLIRTITQITPAAGRTATAQLTVISPLSQGAAVQLREVMQEWLPRTAAKDLCCTPVNSNQMPGAAPRKVCLTVFNIAVILVLLTIAVLLI